MIVNQSFVFSIKKTFHETFKSFFPKLDQRTKYSSYFDITDNSAIKKETNMASKFSSSLSFAKFVKFADLTHVLKLYDKYVVFIKNIQYCTVQSITPPTYPSLRSLLTWHIMQVGKQNYFTYMIWCWWDFCLNKFLP